jgi:hypothetical protein
MKSLKQMAPARFDHEMFEGGGPVKLEKFINVPLDSRKSMPQIHTMLIWCHFRGGDDLGLSTLCNFIKICRDHELLM